MKKLKSSLSKKLKGTAGESIAEVLIALLIAALALTMLASVISTAARTITRSKQQMDAYYAANEWLSAHASSDTDAFWTVTVKNGSKRVYLISESENLTVNYQINDIVGEKNGDTYAGIPVVAFWKAG